MAKDKTPRKRKPPTPETAALVPPASRTPTVVEVATPPMLVQLVQTVRATVEKILDVADAAAEAITGRPDR